MKQSLKQESVRSHQLMLQIDAESNEPWPPYAWNKSTSHQPSVYKYVSVLEANCYLKNLRERCSSSWLGQTTTGEMTSVAAPETLLKEDQPLLPFLQRAKLSTIFWPMPFIAEHYYYIIWTHFFSILIIIFDDDRHSLISSNSHMKTFNSIIIIAIFKTAIEKSISGLQLE